MYTAGWLAPDIFTAVENHQRAALGRSNVAAVHRYKMDVEASAMAVSTLLLAVAPAGNEGRRSKLWALAVITTAVALNATALGAAPSVWMPRARTAMLLWVATRSFLPLQAFWIAMFALSLALGVAVDPLYATWCEVACICAATVVRLYGVLMTLRATHPQSFLLPILTKIVPKYSFDENAFFRADSPPEEVVQRRTRSLATLASPDFKEVTERLGQLRDCFSDTRFTSGAPGVFFPFQQEISARIAHTFMLGSTEAGYLVSTDKSARLLDADSSFGVNLLGYDRYKEFIAEGFQEAKQQSCALGKLTPRLQANAERICKVRASRGRSVALGDICNESVFVMAVLHGRSGRLSALFGGVRPAQIAKKEQCSFHMSGTEAMMGAVRLGADNARGLSGNLGRTIPTHLPFEIAGSLLGHPDPQLRWPESAFSPQVRLARFNTGRPLIVIFYGAYHGWWDGAMTLVGSARCEKSRFCIFPYCFSI
jgi:hypothetical protein